MDRVKSRSCKVGSLVYDHLSSLQQFNSEGLRRSVSTASYPCVPKYVCTRGGTGLTPRDSIHNHGVPVSGEDEERGYDRRHTWSRRTRVHGRTDKLFLCIGWRGYLG